MWAATQSSDLSGSSMTTFLIPVDGLSVESSWSVGQTEILSAAAATQWVAERRVTPTSDFDPYLEPFFDQPTAGSFARVTSADARNAIDAAASAVDVLRVYQQSISRVQTTMFGLPGEHSRASVTYVSFDEKIGTGTIHLGEPLGWTFNDDERRNFEASVPFQFAASCVGSSTLTTSQKLVQVAVQLSSQAILATRPHMQFLSAVMAIEALLLERSNQPGSLRLARRCAYFTCGYPDDFCGRDRPACVILTASTDRKSVRTLRGQRELGDADVRQRCSEWHRVLDWYDTRSTIVHEGSTEVTDKEASRIIFWLTHHLLPGAMTFFAEHENDPLGELDAAIAALP